MSRLSLFGLVATLVLGCHAAPAAAQGLIFPNPPRIVPPRPRPPIPPPPPIQPLSVKSQQVTMRLESGALRVEVEQLFYNGNSVPMEGTYLFPLPEGATVSNFRMLIDKEPVQGKVLDKDEARRIYESYVRRNIDPAILEWVGRNAFQASVFPIPARGERRIYLSYTQVAEFQGGIYKAVYPLNHERVSSQTAGDLAIDCTIQSPQPIKSIYSPTHEIQVRRTGERSARVSYEGKDVRANRDFLLYYSTGEKEFGLNALTHRRIGEDGYAMLMLAPRREPARGEVQAKDVVLVFDTSGSMQGAKIEQARKAAQTILGALNEKDRFNVLRFSTDVSRFRESVVPANRENIEAARAFVQEFRAVGGTAIDDALQTGLASIPPEAERRGRSPFVIFMTDGLPTVGVTQAEQILGNAGKAAPKDLRLFAFGVGADVNTLLLDRLALDNRGAADYVDPNEDLETKIGAFYAKIADPVLSNVRLAVNGATLEQLYPNRIPDLFAGGQLLVLGRYRGHGKVRVSLSGEVNGKPQKFEYDLNLPERELDHDFIPRLWAGRRIGFLMEEIRLKGESKELKDEVIRLSKEHGIVTPYTSYLVEEPGLPTQQFSLYFRDNAGGFGGGGRGATPGAAPAGVAGKPATPADRPATPAEKKQAEQRTELARSARQQAYGLQQSTGWNAVETSKRVRSLKDQEQAQVEVEVQRNIAGRAFRQDKGQWVDQTIPTDPKVKVNVVAVKYGSDAYFKLIAQPQWSRWLSAGRSMRLRTGPTTVVEIGEKGKEKLTDAEMKALEK